MPSTLFYAVAKSSFLVKKKLSECNTYKYVLVVCSCVVFVVRVVLLCRFVSVLMSSLSSTLFTLSPSHCFCVVFVVEVVLRWRHNIVLVVAHCSSVVFVVYVVLRCRALSSVLHRVSCNVVLRDGQVIAIDLLPPLNTLFSVIYSHLADVFAITRTLPLRQLLYSP